MLLESDTDVHPVLGLLPWHGGYVEGPVMGVAQGGGM